MNSSVLLAVPIQFIPNPWDKKDSFERAETFVAAMRSVGFDVIVGRNDERWCARSDASVLSTVKLVDAAFAPRDVAQFAYLARRVHNDGTVQAAYRLGGVAAASALLTSEWVRAQDLP